MQDHKASPLLSVEDRVLRISDLIHNFYIQLNSSKDLNTTVVKPSTSLW